MANNIKVVNNLGKGIEVHITSDNTVEINWESKKKQLSELKPGDIFKDKEGTEYIVCDQLDESTLVIRKDLLKEDIRFGENNDWRESEVKDYLNSVYLQELKKNFGEDAIRKIRTKLTSLDGYDDYGMSDDEVKSIIPKLRVISRCSPNTKLRLVTLAQELGKSVAMTGDGVNDSPALKKSDVGFGMQSGSDVAKEASDIILTDDNFASIVRAVELGRTFMHNIMMFLEFQLPINFSLLILSMVYPIIATGVLLASVQILIINIIMDSLNSLSFGGEPPKEEYMTEKPIKKGSSLFIRGAKKRIAINTAAFIVLYGILILSPISDIFATETEAMTARFALLCFMAVFNGFNIRTEHINLFNGIGKNKLFSVIAIGIFVMTFVLCNFAENLIKVTALDFKHWLVVVILAFMVIPIDLIRKIIEKKRENK